MAGSPFKKNLAVYSTIIDSAFERQCGNTQGARGTLRDSWRRFGNAFAFMGRARCMQFMLAVDALPERKERLKYLTHPTLVDAIRGGWSEASVASLPALNLKYLILRGFHPLGHGGSDGQAAMSGQEIRQLIVRAMARRELPRRIAPRPGEESLVDPAGNGGQRSIRQRERRARGVPADSNAAQRRNTDGH